MKILRCILVTVLFLTNLFVLSQDGKIDGTFQNDTKIKIPNHLIKRSEREWEYSNYIINSPAFNLKKNTFAGKINILSNTGVTYGINDWLSMDGKINVFSLSSKYFLFFLKAKARIIEINNVKIGSSLSNLFSINRDNIDIFHIALFSVYATIGNPYNNLTVGIGQFFNRDAFSRTPLIQISSIIRVAKRTSMIFDSHFISIEESTFSTTSWAGGFANNAISETFYGFYAIPGVRLHKEKYSLDVSIFFLGNLEESNLNIPFFFPWLSFNINLDLIMKR